MTAFLASPTDELRQGDVCGSWVLPKWAFNSLELMTMPGKSPTGVRTGVHAQGEQLLVLVCSHDCEVENTRDRMGILVAPLFDPPYEDADPRAEAVRGSNRPKPSGAAGEDEKAEEFDFIHLYPVLVSQAAREPRWLVADLSAITSMAPASKAVRALRDGKIAEMTDEEREAFQFKMAAFLAR